MDIGQKDHKRILFDEASGYTIHFYFLRFLLKIFLFLLLYIISFPISSKRSSDSFWLFLYHWKTAFLLICFLYLERNLLSLTLCSKSTFLAKEDTAKHSDRALWLIFRQQFVPKLWPRRQWDQSPQVYQPKFIVHASSLVESQWHNHADCPINRVTTRLVSTLPTFSYFVLRMGKPTPIAWRQTCVGHPRSSIKQPVYGFPQSMTGAAAA